MEDTPLLSVTSRLGDDDDHRVTPLPKLQLTVIILVQLAEPLTSQVIYPFIVQFIRETGVSNEDVGFYAGLVGSIFFACEVLTVFWWSRLSDSIGRRPVLLAGLSALAFSMIGIGFSRAIWALVVWRGLAGMMNGTTGVMKSAIAEMTDETNVARAFSFMPVVWSTGVTIGPMLGGFLEHPYEKYPGAFGWIPLFQTYPYLFPCATVGFIIFLIVLLIYFIFIESAPIRQARTSGSPEDGVSGGTPGSLPLPMKALFTRPVVISIANYGMLSLCEISYMVLVPVFYSVPIEMGGLGLSASRIGLIMGIFGLTNGVLQTLFFAPLNKRFGTKAMFTTGILALLPLFAGLPFMNFLARQDGMVSTRIWMMVGVQILLACLVDVAFGCIFIFVSSSPPNKRSLGAVNGLAQLCASLVRTIGPALITSLFSISVHRNILGGMLAYVVFWGFAIIALGVSRFLPSREWKRPTN